jgi:hypothetical protein
MATETRTPQSRINLKALLAVAVYSVVLFAASTSALILFSALDAGELAVRESAAVMIALSPMLVFAGLAVTGAHYVLERVVGVFGE